jgi:hypothetical protein
MMTWGAIVGTPQHIVSEDVAELVTNDSSDGMFAVFPFLTNYFLLSINFELLMRRSFVSHRSSVVARCACTSIG